MKNPFTSFLYFGKSEKVAIIVLILLIIAIIILPEFYNSINVPESVNNPALRDEIAEFLEEEESSLVVEPSGFDYSNPDRSVVKQTITPFGFDPNTLDREGWQRLGFTEKQTSGILKFREKGGRFYKKEDLKKLYAVTDEVYNSLEPHITIADSRKTALKEASADAKYSGHSVYKIERYKAELNSADSAELVKVYGIGPATARRILKYRDRLGGFAFIEQLREVTGIDSARFEMIRDGVFTDPDVIKKIDINRSAITQLRQHPYIDYYIAKAIVDNRVKKGSYSSVEELREIPLIYDALFKKLRPYISITQ